MRPVLPKVMQEENLNKKWGKAEFSRIKKRGFLNII